MASRKGIVAGNVGFGVTVPEMDLTAEKMKH
jgi:hypothetical protein